MTIEDYRKTLDVIADRKVMDDQLPVGFRVGAFYGLQIAMNLLPEQFDTVSVSFGQLASDALKRISYKLAEIQDVEHDEAWPTMARCQMEAERTAESC